MSRRRRASQRATWRDLRSLEVAGVEVGVGVGIGVGMELSLP